MKNFRDDIQGLRGISIVLVILHHYFGTKIPNGFVGVDVFFLISGFLITNILTKEMSNNKFNLLLFYMKRVVRLLPAYIFISFFIILISWSMFFPAEFKELGAEYFWSNVFQSNGYFKKAAGYFDKASVFKPLLHTWSLSVEWKFYLLWPSVLCFVFFLQRSVFFLRVSYVAYFLLFISIIHPIFFGWEYYSFSSRVWELALGSVLSITQNKNVFKFKEIWGFSFFILTLLLIIPIVKELSKVHAIVVAILSSFCLIHFKNSWVNKKILSSKFLTYVGNISYPLYLWHWPLFSISSIYFCGKLSSIYKVFLIVFSVFLSHLTTKYVEKPFRNKNKINIKSIFCILFLILSIFISLLIKNGKIEVYKENRRESVSSNWWNADKEMLNVDGFFIKKGNSRENVLFLGDSNMQMYYPRLKDSADKLGINSPNLVFSVSGGCLPIPNTYDQKVLHCSNLLKATLNYIKKHHIKKIIICSAWAHHFFKREYRYKNIYLLKEKKGETLALISLKKMIDVFYKEGISVYLIGSIPNHRLFKAECSFNRFIFWNKRNKKCVEKNNKVEKDKFLRISTLNKNLSKICSNRRCKFINPLDYLCDKKACFSRDKNGFLIYRDDRHLNPSYVRDKVRYLDLIL